MWARVLGAAAGGGFPQWNCACPRCLAVRNGSQPCQPLTQSSVAVSGDYRNWYVLNASPDIRAQVEAFPALHPHDVRESPIKAVLLTDAELDHTLGLLLLRESDSLQIHGTKAARETLTEGTHILKTLGGYTEIDWREVVAGEEVPLNAGLSYRAFDAPTSKQARFGTGAEDGSVIGYRISDENTGGSLVYLPGTQDLTDETLSEIEGCSCLLVDGTCWQDDEIALLGIAKKTAREMGHMPISGEDGSLKKLSSVDAGRKIYIHINNTNPILIEDSPERRVVEESGFEVAWDGLEMEF